MTWSWFNFATLASPFVAAVVGFVIKRALDRQDKERAAQTALIEKVGSQVSGMVRDFAALKVTVGYHEEELRRFRVLVDSWNSGPKIQ